MKIVVETTTWADAWVPNHTYVLNDSMTKMVGYVPAGSRKLTKFKKPQSFDVRGRTFEDLGETEPEPEVIVVEGSRGNKYFVSDEGNGWICSCPGFKFHGTCKHLKALDKA